MYVEIQIKSADLVLIARWNHKTTDQFGQPSGEVDCRSILELGTDNLDSHRKARFAQVPPAQLLPANPHTIAIVVQVRLSDIGTFFPFTINRRYSNGCLWS